MKDAVEACACGSVPVAADALSSQSQVGTLMGSRPSATALPSSSPVACPEPHQSGNPLIHPSSAEHPASRIPSTPRPLTPDTCHSFSRFPGETARAFSAFVTWFQLGHARSHQAVADKLGEGLPTVKNWASKYDWSDRLLTFTSGVLQQQALDTAEQQRKQAADWADRLNRFREQEWDAAQKLLSAAQCFLETFGDDHVHNMTLSQVSRALSISSAIARSALAGIELPPSDEPTLAPIQQQMLDALKRLSTPSPVGTEMGSRPSATPSLNSSSPDPKL